MMCYGSCKWWWRYPTESNCPQWLIAIHYLRNTHGTITLIISKFGLLTWRYYQRRIFQAWICSLNSTTKDFLKAAINVNHIFSWFVLFCLKTLQKKRENVQQCIVLSYKISPNIVRNLNILRKTKTWTQYDALLTAICWDTE